MHLHLCIAVSLSTIRMHKKHHKAIPVSQISTLGPLGVARSTTRCLISLLRKRRFADATSVQDHLNPLPNPMPAFQGHSVQLGRFPTSLRNGRENMSKGTVKHLHRLDFLDCLRLSWALTLAHASSEV